ncbi:MAG TPA: hypothetical protein VF744_08555 [Beijerinckiaceae bacterium]
MTQTASRRRAGAKIGLSALVLALGLLGPAGAQEPLPPITVRPSGVEDEGAVARERQERLLRRREESAYRFRHICTHCLDGAVAGAPFYPFQALSPGKAPE